MGIFDTIRDLLGSGGLSDVVESTGLTDHLGGLTDAVQAPVEQLGGLTDAVQAPIEDLGAAAEDVTAAVDPLAEHL